MQQVSDGLSDHILAHPTNSINFIDPLFHPFGYFLTGNVMIRRKNRCMKFICSVILFCVVHSGIAQTNFYDLAITHSKVFNSRTGRVDAGQTILIKAGIIELVTASPGNYTTAKTIDAAGRLITPGFIDTHIHLTDVFGDYDKAPARISTDSISWYRKKLSDTYLPYGVTTVMIMGEPEAWLPLTIDWMKNPDSDCPDVYTVGGALISKESRKPYLNHITVSSPGQASRKIIEYYRMGIRHIKLYWRLRKPEFEAAFKTADSLGMRVFGHIDQNIMFMDTTLAIGLLNYEHIMTLDNSVIHFAQDGSAFDNQIKSFYGNSSLSFSAVRMEMWRFMHIKKRAALEALINKLANNKTSFSTTIHLFAAAFGLSYFSDTRDASLTASQLARCKENFDIFMQYAKKMYDKGIRLRIGTDCANGGKSLLSELLLLHEHGFSTADFLQIATINGASALGLENQCGVIEKGKKANLLIWDKNPFLDYKNFLSSKTIIKDGAALVHP
jgi:imidazolonepropionase-like amidohydrolase